MLASDYAQKKKQFVWLDSERVDGIIRFDVWMGWWFSRFVSLFLLRSRHVEIEPFDVVHGSRYVIAANHQSLLDPFIISSQFPVRVWKHMGTLRYFAANGLFKVPVFRAILMGWGCFPARQTPQWPSGLDYGIRQLGMGKTVLIFPEGRRTVSGTGAARHGVEVLAKSHPHAMVVPAHIEWKRQAWWWRSFRIGIGKPFDASKMTAQEILDRIYDLPVR